MNHNYPLAGKGRKPYPLSTMLRIHFLQHWYGYSDAGMEEALHDIPMLRRFGGLDAGESRMPDETTILNFRHLLEAHQLAESLFQEVVSLLTEQGLISRSAISALGNWEWRPCVPIRPQWRARRMLLRYRSSRLPDLPPGREFRWADSIAGKITFMQTYQFALGDLGEALVVARVDLLL